MEASLGAILLRLLFHGAYTFVRSCLLDFHRHIPFFSFPLNSYLIKFAVPALLSSELCFFFSLLVVFFRVFLQGC
ncbi:hypothetical protein BJX76DRAFT_330146 [Aspergillus varians]